MKRKRNIIIIVAIVVMIGIMAKFYLIRNEILQFLWTMPNEEETERIELTYFVNTPVDSVSWYYNMREADSTAEKLLTDHEMGHRNLYQEKKPFKVGKIDLEEVFYAYVDENGQKITDTVRGENCWIEISETHNATLEIKDGKYIFYLQEEIVATD